MTLLQWLVIQIIKCIVIWVLKQRLQFQVFSSVLSLAFFSLARQYNSQVAHFQSATDKCSGKTASQAVENL